MLNTWAFYQELQVVTNSCKKAHKSSGNVMDKMLKHEYARSALKLGLRLETKLGVNPYKFGLQGASDAHTSLAGEAENNYWGKLSLYEPAPGRA